MSSDTTLIPPECEYLDPYGFPVRCDQAEPCVDGDGTLWTVTECYDGQLTLDEFCVEYPAHPACVGRPVVEVGTPPTVPTSTLPPTGTSELIGAGAWIFVGVGLILVGITRRRHSKETIK